MPQTGKDYPGSYAELLAWFPDEPACLDYLEWLRWPDGFRCPRCVSRTGWRLSSGRWECAVCGRQASVTAGTIFHRTRTPLRLWFAAAWQMTSQKHGVSALGLQRALGLGSYQTAWAMLHRYRAAMVRPGRERLSGLVEVDETFVGGHEEGRPGRAAETKSLVAIAVEIKQPKGFGRVRMQRVDAIRNEFLIPFITGAVEPGATVHTDGNQSYWSLPDRGYEHERTVMSQQNDPAHVVMPAVHRIASLLKRWLLRHPPRLRRTRPPRRVPQRVHVPLQPTRLPTSRPAVLPPPRTSDPRRTDHLPEPDRQPTPRTPTANAAEAISAIAGGPATLADPNLTQIDTPLDRLRFSLRRRERKSGPERTPGESKFSMTGPRPASGRPMTQIASGTACGRSGSLNTEAAGLQPPEGDVRASDASDRRHGVPFGVLRTSVATACAGRQWCLG